MNAKYLIVGGGVAAASAVEGIRAYDPDGPIRIVSRENHAPYRRPFLSKDLWFNADAADRLSVHEPRWYQERGVDLMLRREIVEIDPETRTAWDDRGGTLGYDQLLLATGVRPRILDVKGADHPELHYFRSLEDYLQLRHRLGQIQHALVIGEDFLSVELAAAIRHRGHEVSFMFPHDYPLQAFLPRDLGAFVLGRCRELGIESLSNEAILEFEDHAELLVGRTRAGNFVMTQTGIVSAGSDPQVELAEAAGLEIGNGIEVDEYARTSAPNVYAAGDVAEFPYLALQRTRRLELWDHAMHHGRAAGANMAGADLPYTYLPVFFGRVFDADLEAVGEIDATLETQLVWREPFQEGVLLYVSEGVTRGVLMWNLVGNADWAGEMIREGRELTDGEREDLVIEALGGQEVRRPVPPTV
jgi:3-phenylpropionate/trans-cinnamate dioxygenase ferredoxin reductase component